jgi:multicomponent Na+:H+ antiporter subunit D
MPISLNPGFALILAAACIWALPRPVRFAVMLGAALAALALPLAPTFGDHAAFGHFGLQVVPLRLDEISQWLGLAAALIAVMAALSSLTRDRRGEDAYLCLLAGGAISALYAGDLVSFAATTALSAFALVALAFQDAHTMETRAAARRIMAWMALAGLLLTAGSGVFLAESKSVRFDQVGLDNLGGVILAIGLGVLIGAPGPHVWQRDGAVRFSASAAPFALCLAPLLAFYGFARAFPGESALALIGAGMVGIALPQALAQDDLRRAWAYGSTAAWGMALMVLSVPSSTGLAGASAMAFTNAIGLCGAGLAGMAIFQASGGASARQFRLGDRRAMPLTGGLYLVCALSVAGVPGLAGYVAKALALEAAALQGAFWIWPMLLVASAGLVGALVVRMGLLLTAAPGRGRGPADPAEEPPLLALSIALSVCVGAAAAPGWMYGLLPPDPVAFSPYRLGEVLAAVQVLAAGAAGHAAARGFGLAPLGQNTPDLDVLWRGMHSLGRGPAAAWAHRFGGWARAAGALALNSTVAGVAWMGDALADLQTAGARRGPGATGPGATGAVLAGAAGLAALWLIGWLSLAG